MILCWGGDPAYMFNPALFGMYVLVVSQEPVIQWMSFFMCYILVFRSFFLHKFVRLFSRLNIVLQCHFSAFYWLLYAVLTLLIVESCIWPIVFSVCVIWSFVESSYWHSCHIRGRVGIPLTCLTPPYFICTCLFCFSFIFCT